MIINYCLTILIVMFITFIAILMGAFLYVLFKVIQETFK